MSSNKIIDKSLMLKKNMGGIVIIVLYSVLFLLITYFHEPWFDEAQAWEIGSTATYKEMLTVLPHTEGHPPLWSLLLSIPAKLGVSYYVGLKGVSFLFSTIVVELIVFKAPFPKIIKYLLPFTYFVFYQFGVISRTYCVMELAFVLIAITLKDRDKKPLRLIGSILLLCLTTAYGIVISGGICICWVFDIIKEYNKEKKLKELFLDKRIKFLFYLFIIVLILCFMIKPIPNAYAVNGINLAVTIKRFFYALFVLLGDSFISAGGIPAFSSLVIIDFLPGFLFTILIYVFIFLLSKGKTVKYFFFPYIMYSFLIGVYASDHHAGIGFFWLISYIWAIFDEDIIRNRFNSYLKKYEKLYKSINIEHVRKLIKVIIFFMIGISIFYSLEYSIEDVFRPYSESKEIARFIKDHNMESADIMVQWNMDVQGMDQDEQKEKADIDKYESENTYKAVSIVPYFDKNIFFNHNIENHEKGYASHIKKSRSENIRTYKLWHNYGIPEVLIGSPELGLVYDGEISISDFVSVAAFTGYYMGKNSTLIPQTLHIYVRKDCLDKFGLSQEAGK